MVKTIFSANLRQFMPIELFPRSFVRHTLSLSPTCFLSRLLCLPSFHPTLSKNIMHHVRARPSVLYVGSLLSGRTECDMASAVLVICLIFYTLFRPFSQLENQIYDLISYSNLFLGRLCLKQDKKLEVAIFTYSLF